MMEKDITVKGQFLGSIRESELTGGWSVIAPDGTNVALVWSREDARKELQRLAAEGRHQK